MVRIVALNDNRCSNDSFEHEHGISLYMSMGTEFFDNLLF